MPIVSSTFVLDSAYQIDGRIYCDETHIDDSGGEYLVNYLSEADADHATIATERGVVISEELAMNEAEELINGS